MSRIAKKSSHPVEDTLICRSCGQSSFETVVDLGLSPLANSYVSKEDLQRPESFYPLHPRVCTRCWLVQIPVFEKPEEIFTNYAYFSSFSESWVNHAKRYCEFVIQRFGLGEGSFVVEVASNDGYLLRNFIDANIPCLGIEPAKNVAKHAIAEGIPTEVEFFGHSYAKRLVKKHSKADLIVANNVLAQVPDIHDFLSGMKVLLSSRGVLTIEFPHLLTTIEKCEFDTVYHEHFSYFSVIALDMLLARHDLKIFDIQELPTHGGSLRVFVKHARNGMQREEEVVDEIRERERTADLDSVSGYQRFSERVRRVKNDLLTHLIRCKNEGLRVCAYGAPAKGNTLLNFCGIRTDYIDFTVDKNPEKQGKFLPGTRIPVLDPSVLKTEKPDRILILPWNLKDEIMTQCQFVRQWNAKFIIPIPEVVEE